MRYRFFPLVALIFFMAMVAASAVGQGGGRNHDDRDNGSNNGWWDRDTNAPWPPRGDWHGGHWDGGGACFYKDRNFDGRYFCMRRGEARNSLGGYGDDISSIRVFGSARVVIFDDRNFSGAKQMIRGAVNDLRQLGVRQKPGHTWNNRISSIRVQ
jgi:Peptidase inhibitor family I36